jgi:hypothetical protein
MKRKMMVFGFAILASSLTSAPVALAEEGDSSVKTENLKDGYSYKFTDDPLDAAPNSARGARIRVRPGASRTLLIRPRTHFVREIFKSAENF